MGFKKHVQALLIPKIMFRTMYYPQDGSQRPFWLFFWGISQKTGRTLREETIRFENRR